MSLRKTTLATAMSVLLVAVAVAGSSLAAPRLAPRGRILTPKPGQSVSRRIVVKGTLSSIPPKDHVWLAVERGAQIWPKKPQIDARKRSWKVIVGEGEPLNVRFSLSLLVVDAAGNRVIERWFTLGDRTGSYPALSAAGIHLRYRLCVVRNLVIRHG